MSIVSSETMDYIKRQKRHALDEREYRMAYEYAMRGLIAAEAALEAIKVAENNSRLVIERK